MALALADVARGEGVAVDMSLSKKLEAARVALGKRKERELQTQQGPAKAELGKPAPAPALGSNKLLAGYLAHEFLTRGTLQGRPVEPCTFSSSSSSAAADPGATEPDLKRRYAEVSWLLIASGARVPGVVNPTQLAHWLQIKD